MVSPLVSVIVPVYNADIYLTRCLDSLAAQSYGNIEILLVDDGSTDGSGRICDERASDDSRFRVLHLANGGVSRARNAALDVMRGEWVCFADADDEVGPDYARHFAEAAEDGVDLIIGEAVFSKPSGEVENLRYAKYGVLGLKDIFTVNLLPGRGYVCAKCYRSSRMRDTSGQALRFAEGVHFAEDLLFALAYLEGSPRAKYIPHADYTYYLRDGSASGKVFGFSDERRGFELYLERMRALSSAAGADLLSVPCAASLLSMLFSRVRNSVYRREGLSRSERLKYFRGLDAGAVGLIRANSAASNAAVRLGYRLLGDGKRWGLWDAYNEVIYKIKQTVLLV